MRVGTSGFAYPGWSPRFYPADLPDGDFLRHYATVFDTCELNGTFYARPSARAIARWLRATGPDFRFIVKAQRGSSFRAFGADPEAALRWLTDPLPGFGDRLGAVLFRVPSDIRREGPADDARLRAVLAAWPRSIPLVVELQDPSWQTDETFAALRDADAVLCATELDGAEPPDLRLTGPFLYLRLRRASYDATEIAAWADRLMPFLAAGHDAFTYFRHDEDGTSTESARALRDAVADRLGTPPGA